jgi:hypothetical protein
MKPTYSDRLKHVSREIKFVLENDKLSEQTIATLERLVDEVDALHPPAGVRSVEIHSAFKKPVVNWGVGEREGKAPPVLEYSPPEGQIDVVIAANDGEEVHFRVCGVVEIIKPEPEIEEPDDLTEDDKEFADRWDIPYSELAIFKESNREAA